MRKRKSEEKESRRREKSSVCTLSFYNGHFEDCFWPKKSFGRKGPFVFGDDVFKNPARHVSMQKRGLL